jgi:hypothetical protein
MGSNALSSARDISRRLHPYCTVLLKLFIDPLGKARIAQVGSGTYVRYRSRFGILTATHCTEPLGGTYVLGVSAAGEGNEHNFTLDPRAIEILPIAHRDSDEY